jgi:hypothetical protein
VNNDRARNHVASYPLDDDLILLDTRAQRIFVLNQSAAFLWAGLEAGLSAAEVAAEISRQTGTPLANALQDCEALIAEWTAAGLRGDVADDLGTAARERCYRIAGVEFRITGPTGPMAAVHVLLGHMSVDPSSIAPDSASLTITATAGGWALSAGQREFGECENLEQLVPLVHANVLLMTYESSECFMALHSAAVSRGDTCVLLPGLPGNGKSTLTAALLATGYDFGTDDLAMLSGRPLRVRALPLRVGLKSGSWPVLRDRIPELEAVPSHLRADGQWIKYWLPPPDRLPRDASARLRVAALVFPRYSPDTTCALVPITRSQALLRVSEAGYHLPRGQLDHAWMEATLEWLGTLSCFELNYADLDEAVNAFARVLP